MVAGLKTIWESHSRATATMPTKPRLGSTEALEEDDQFQHTEEHPGSTPSSQVPGTLLAANAGFISIEVNDMTRTEAASKQTPH